MATEPKGGPGRRSVDSDKIVRADGNGRALTGSKGRKRQSGESLQGTTMPIAESGGAEPSKGPKQKRQKQTVSEDKVAAKSEQLADEGCVSDSELQALKALRRVAASENGSRPIGRENISEEVVDWRRALQKLRAKQSRVQEERAEQDSHGHHKLEPNELIAKVRDAVAQKCNWTAVISPGFAVTPKEMQIVVRALEISEVGSLFRAAMMHYEWASRDEVLCCLWISKILENANTSKLLALKHVSKGLRRFETKLQERLERNAPVSEAISCYGKWRYIEELAAASRGEDGTGERQALDKPLDDDEPSTGEDEDGDDAANNESDEE